MLLFGDVEWSFRDLDRRSSAFARQLAAVGIGRGQRVALTVYNRPEFLLSVYAIGKLGAAPVLLKRHNAALICLARRRVDVLFAMIRAGSTYQPPQQQKPTSNPRRLDRRHRDTPRAPARSS